MIFWNLYYNLIERPLLYLERTLLGTSRHKKYLVVCALHSLIDTSLKKIFSETDFELNYVWNVPTHKGIRSTTQSILIQSKLFRFRRIQIQDLYAATEPRTLFSQYK